MGPGSVIDLSVLTAGGTDFGLFMSPSISCPCLENDNEAIELGSFYTPDDHLDGTGCTTRNAFKKIHSEALRDPGGLSCGFYR